MPKSKRAESRCRYLVREIARQKGWDMRHPQKGGDVLEEQEIEDYFPGTGLHKAKPDFLFCLHSAPLIVVEAKNDLKKIDAALAEAIKYADTINQHGKYSVSIAVGVAGEEDHGYEFKTMIFNNGSWVSLTSHGFALTSFPSVGEIETALLTKNGTTTVAVPKVSDYITTAIELSSVLRSAKIEPSLRPKVLGAVITALYQGEIDLAPGKTLSSVNSLVRAAITSTDHFEDRKKKHLIEALRLTEADYARLAPKMGRIVYTLKVLNIKSLLRTDTDFLGLLYEAFIRYGYDNNSLGIVFTPRHITKFCADLIDVTASDTVIDIACGSGGFLVASFDRMMKTADQQGIPFSDIREALYGFDTNPTVWALASLNMFFRGDGKSHIENSSCFDKKNAKKIAGHFTKALLNPPFSQDEEPERDFIDAAMKALNKQGILAVVVKSGIFADEDNADWRKQFLASNSVLGMISLPNDLFYPTAVDTTIMIAAPRAQRASDDVFMAKIWNDGYRKLKGKRVEAPGSQLDEVLQEFRKFRQGLPVSSDLVTVIKAADIMAEGAEFCPEEYLPQPVFPQQEQLRYQEEITKSLLTTAICLEDIAGEVLVDFPVWKKLPPMPYGKTESIETFFDVTIGKSRGESSYNSGSCPYISSGDPQNSVVRLVNDVAGEVFPNGAITVTCFGKAYVQPWRFMARGNGGSSVRVLTPRYSMTFSELAWFAAQINMQRWRFFYGRMAILKRLKKIRLTAPQAPLPDSRTTIAEKVVALSKNVVSIMKQ